MDLSAGLKYNNYIGSRKIRSLLKGRNYEFKIKNIDINGQKRGCSGFIKSIRTGKMCYISTEMFFDRNSGSGLFLNPQKAILIREAAGFKDYQGGYNHFVSADDFVQMVENLID